MECTHFNTLKKISLSAVLRQMYSLMVSEKISAITCFKTSYKNKRRIISINKVKESLKAVCNYVVNMGLDGFTNALVNLHAFTGCDIVSVFANLRKLKEFKIIAKNIAYMKLFEKLREDWLGKDRFCV